jgi:hypothetical protein
MKADFLPFACPTCRAGFRGKMTCARCGTDLAPLMRVMAKAYQLRVAARRATAAGKTATAERLAELAVRLHRTESGLNLLERLRLSASYMPPTEAQAAKRNYSWNGRTF